MQAGASVNDQARARRFRFRVYEGGETSDTATQLETRHAGNNALTSKIDSNIDLGNSDSLDGQSRAGSRSGGRDAGLSNPGGGASSAFLAQSIAQEQLGDGLYNPPYAAAAAAYTRTGASVVSRSGAGIDISA